MNRDIKFTSERDIMTHLGNVQLNNNDFIGKSYLIANNIHPNWFPLFRANQYLLCNIFDQLENITYYPKHSDVFNAFTIDPVRLKCLILAQDPYHGKGQAHGYSFSVQRDVEIPPSLVNIFKEIDLEYPGQYKFTNGNLEAWCSPERSDVFLLNASLTVLPKSPNSHADLWKEFTDNVIEYLSMEYEHKVFLLLGSFAKKKSIFIDVDKHTVIGGVHPSPLSAHTGYFNSGIFRKVDQALVTYGKDPVNWQN
jgi:uracil-DNA glycosylase